MFFLNVNNLSFILRYDSKRLIKSCFLLIYFKGNLTNSVESFQQSVLKTFFFPLLFFISSESRIWNSFFFYFPRANTWPQTLNCWQILKLLFHCFFLPWSQQNFALLFKLTFFFFHQQSFKKKVNMRLRVTTRENSLCWVAFLAFFILFVFYFLFLFHG